MSEQLLTRVRSLNEMLSESTTGYVSFDELCNSMGKMLNSFVFVISRRGKCLAVDTREQEIDFEV